MAADEDVRRLVEWALWSVRVSDLPAGVRAAAHRLARSGDYPRPAAPHPHGPLTCSVTAFPIDETLPLRGRLCAREGAGQAVTDLLAPDISYMLIRQGRLGQSGDGHPGSPSGS